MNEKKAQELERSEQSRPNACERQSLSLVLSLPRFLSRYTRRDYRIIVTSLLHTATMIMLIKMTLILITK